MTDLETVDPQRTIVAHQPTSYTREQVELIKRTVADGTSDDELSLFLEVAKRRQLDPFSGQIHAVMRHDSRKGRKVMTIQVGLHGQRAIASRTGLHDYTEGPEFTADGETWTDTWISDEPPTAARCRVKRKDQSKPHQRPVLWSEYAQYTRKGDLTSMWANLGVTMLGKVAEVHALRAAFPDELGAFYAPEEMDQATTPADTTDDSDGDGEEPAIDHVDERRDLHTRFMGWWNDLDGDTQQQVWKDSLKGRFWGDGSWSDWFAATPLHVLQDIVDSLVGVESEVVEEGDDQDPAGDGSGQAMDDTCDVCGQRHGPDDPECDGQDTDGTDDGRLVCAACGQVDDHSTDDCTSTPVGDYEAELAGDDEEAVDGPVDTVDNGPDEPDGDVEDPDYSLGQYLTAFRELKQLDADMAEQVHAAVADRLTAPADTDGANFPDWWAATPQGTRMQCTAQVLRALKTARDESGHVTVATEPAAADATDAPESDGDPAVQGDSATGGEPLTRLQVAIWTGSADRQRAIYTGLTAKDVAKALDDHRLHWPDVARLEGDDGRVTVAHAIQRQQDWAPDDAEALTDALNIRWAKAITTAEDPEIIGWDSVSDVAKLLTDRDEHAPQPDTGDELGALYADVLAAEQIIATARRF